MIEQPTKMEAGPELDAEIARRVFGEEPCDQWHYVSLGPASGWVRNDGHDADLHICYPEQCPVEYSQRIQAAWLVVEKMRTRDLWLSIEPDPDAWCVQFCRSGERRGDFVIMVEEYADNAPLAICRAALAARNERPAAS